MLLYCNAITSRVQYITAFFGEVISNSALQITSSVSDYKQYPGIKINYSPARIADSEIWLRPHSLLFEKDIVQQQIDCFNWNGQAAFFKTEGDFPFDIFAASFYLLSRYEEYLPHSKDMYGRYLHENSLAYRQNFLNQPLINHWIHRFSAALKNSFPGFDFPSGGNRVSVFTFLPTYDIDIAWSYRHKGWWRNTGGLLRSFARGKWREIRERASVLAGRQKDPYDAYGWMNQLHQRYNLKPYYFFLVPDKNSRYDKNISPRKKEMRQLIYDHAIRYPAGVHPSWRSGDEDGLLKKEIDTLSAITGSAILSSRQHYIRFTLPATFRKLIDNGIRFDFSMGYGSINGFRASVASPFYWYDLENEKQTELLLFPFCFMEANSFYEQKYTAVQALEELRHYYKTVKEVNGYFIMIWHNSFLGPGALFADWRNMYEQFIKETIVRC